MRKLRAAVSILGIFAGLGGATHGPGEILQGNTVPSTLIIEAWPELTALSGEPAMTIIPSFMITGVLAILVGVLVAAWAGAYVGRRGGGVVLILLSIALFLVGGGLIPPLFGMAAGVIAALFMTERGAGGA